MPVIRPGRPYSLLSRQIAQKFAVALVGVAGFLKSTKLQLETACPPIAEVPFEVVHRRPIEVPAHVSAGTTHVVDDGEMLDDVAHPHAIVVAAHAVLRDVDQTVERIGMKIGKRDVLAVDPAADIDARVVEVHIRLDDSSAVAGLTNLKVEVRIDLKSDER